MKKIIQYSTLLLGTLLFISTASAEDVTGLDKFAAIGISENTASGFVTSCVEKLIPGTEISKAHVLFAGKKDSQVVYQLEATIRICGLWCNSWRTAFYRVTVSDNIDSYSCDKIQIMR